MSTVHDLCAVLGMDFFSTVTEVHPSLNDSTGVQSKSISNDTLSRLAKTVLALKEDKRQRLQKVIVLYCMIKHLEFVMSIEPRLCCILLKECNVMLWSVILHVLCLLFPLKCILIC